MDSTSGQFHHPSPSHQSPSAYLSAHLSVDKDTLTTQVLEVVAGFRGVAIESLAEQIWINTTLMFKVAPFPP